MTIFLIEKVKSVPRELQLITQVESAEGLINFRDICCTLQEGLAKSNTSLAAVIFGSDDFCASIGCTRSPGGWELMYARQKIVTIAKAFKLQAIDMVDINFKDIESFRKYAKEGAAMGFTGKQVIHPNQVQPAHECFAPSESKVKWATDLMAAFHRHSLEGKGAFVFENQMIDKPSLLQAENIKILADIIKQRRSSS
ncbi:CLYBL [Bugula neritina]|uniref:CLYBL n=1 Tax=Bugula neritina TaxID=10212 RepID=A0A7J7K3Z3_BUGNE|nr:CLYBL [Bugula neritina]